MCVWFELRELRRGGSYFAGVAWGDHSALLLHGPLSARGVGVEYCAIFGSGD